VFQSTPLIVLTEPSAVAPGQLPYARLLFDVDPALPRSVLVQILETTSRCWTDVFTISAFTEEIVKKMTARCDGPLLASSASDPSVLN